MPTPVRPPLALLAALLCAALSTGCGGGADDRALADASTAATSTSVRRAAAAAPERRVSIAAPADDGAVSPHDGLPDPSVSQPARVPPVAWPPVPLAAADASAPRD